MWAKGKHAALWREHHELLRTPQGVAYRDALIAELDSFRALLRQWEPDSYSRTHSRRCSMGNVSHHGMESSRRIPGALSVSASGRRRVSTRAAIAPVKRCLSGMR